MIGWGGSSSCYPIGFEQEEECTTPKSISGNLDVSKSNQVLRLGGIENLWTKRKMCGDCIKGGLFTIGGRRAPLAAPGFPIANIP